MISATSLMVLSDEVLQILASAVGGQPRPAPKPDFRSSCFFAPDRRCSNRPANRFPRHGASAGIGRRRCFGRENAVPGNEASKSQALLMAAEASVPGNRPEPLLASPPPPPPIMAIAFHSLCLRICGNPRLARAGTNSRCVPADQNRAIRLAAPPTTRALFMTFFAADRRIDQQARPKVAGGATAADAVYSVAGFVLGVGG